MRTDNFASLGVTAKLSATRAALERRSDYEKALTLLLRSTTAQGAQAFARLLVLAETHDSGQARCIAQFIASAYDGAAFPFDLFELRAVDETIGDDMLACLDALRWGQADLYRLIPDGETRVRAVIASWGLKASGDA